MSLNLNLAMGASNWSKEDRQKNDFYATHPVAMTELLKHEVFCHNVWECACGMGHLANVLAEYGYKVRCTDIEDYGMGNEIVDFLSYEENWHGDIITNPPYKHASDFIRKAMDIVDFGSKVAMFLKIQFLEGKERRALFMEYPPKKIYVSTSRIKIAKDGDFDKYSGSSGSVCYAWFIWEKGYRGDTVVKWFN